MPTAVYDASLVTFRARSKALYAFNAANTAAVNAGASVKREQPTFQSAEVLLVRKQGGCFCATDASGLSYNRSTNGPCSCSR
jgi:hypothetical protein